MNSPMLKGVLPSWYEEFLKELSVDRVMNDVRWMVKEVPNRLSGTEGAERAAAYLADQLRSEGIQVEVDQVPGYLSIPGPASLEVLIPEQQSFEARTFAHSGSTGPEGIEGELVYLGPGAESNYHGVDAKGKVVLVELSYAPPRPEKIRLALANGAIGVVMMNWGLDDSTVLPNGTCKPVWGNPRPEDMRLMPTLPAVGIARRDGIFLKNLVSKGPVRVSLKSEASRGWHTMSQPRAVIRAADDETQERDFLILCGHLDSWPIGATDNAAGNAVILEIARALHRHRNRLKRDVWILFWQGHENGIMAGSTWFVDHYWEALQHSAVGHFNIDTPGMEGSSVWRANSTGELVNFHRVIEQQLIPGYPTLRGRVPRTGDQSFFGLGVPSITARTTHTQEQVESWHGATLGWWYHSAEDTLDRVDRNLLELALRVTAGYSLGLVTAPILPYDFRVASQEVMDRLQELEGVLAGRSDLVEQLDLAGLNDAAKELLEVSEQVEVARREALETAGEELQAHWNSALKEASRTLTHAKYTVSGVYGQDPYGLSATATELPGLASIPRLAKLDRDDHESHLLYTEVRRQRNRLKDALDNTRAILAKILEGDKGGQRWRLHAS